jgi:hypothetical protein
MATTNDPRKEWHAPRATVGKANLSEVASLDCVRHAVLRLKPFLDIQDEQYTTYFNASSA